MRGGGRAGGRSIVLSMHSISLGTSCGWGVVMAAGECAGLTTYGTQTDKHPAVHGSGAMGLLPWVCCHGSVAMANGIK